MLELVFDLKGHGKGSKPLRRSLVVGAGAREELPLSGCKQKALREKRG